MADDSVNPEFLNVNMLAPPTYTRLEPVQYSARTTAVDSYAGWQYTRYGENGLLRHIG